MKTYIKLLLVVLLLMALPAVVPAQFNFITNTDNATHTNITITGYTGPGGAVTIPDTTNGYPVTSIGTKAFYGCLILTNVVIPDSISSIALSAFQQCSNLTSVVIPDSVTNIGNGVFVACTSLTNVVIPNSVTTIPNAMFFLCSSLNNVVIPNSVTNVGILAFNYCTSLSSVTIGTGVRSINGFSSCTSLTNIVIPKNVTNIEDQTFSYCSNLTGVYFQGNAPKLGGSEFYHDTNAIAYYLPGTTGWDHWVSPPPAVLWNPTPQSPAVQANQFGFTITGTANIPLAVEACSNLGSATWTALQTCTLTNGSIYFSDPNWGNYPARAYRIRSP